MTIEKLVTLARKKPKNGRWLGVDLGSKTLGLAITDPNLIIATPLKTLQRTKFSKDLPYLQKVIIGYNVSSFVFGLPTNMNGEEGRRAQATRDFVSNLSTHISLPVVFWDERLSTVAVQRLMIEEANLSRQKRARSVDKMAAAFILQGALDALKNHVSEP